MDSHTQWSPQLEKCCLLLSANESYQRAAEDIQVLTGIAVSRSTQQRLVHRQCFEVPPVEDEVNEISIDGGKVRLRTAKGHQSIWRDYKGVNLHQQSVGAFFQDNTSLVNWVNQHTLATPIICLGDGHDGIWNIFEAIGTHPQRQEILDWYHLVENLGKLEAPKHVLDSVETLLWQGKLNETVEQLHSWNPEKAEGFIKYLTKHQHRIVNYGYYQAEGISIGSGAIESTIKQIGRRIKISGAQWEKENVPQVLKHRCAYLNGQFSK